MKTFFLSALLVIVTTASLSQEFRLPPTPVGKAVNAYFESFNSGDTLRMKEFYAAYMDEDRPVADRLRMYQRMRGQLGTVRPVRLLRREGDEVIILAESDRMGALRFSLRFTGGEHPRLLGIGIDEASGDDMPAERAPTMDAFTNRLADELRKRTEEDRFAGAVFVSKDGSPVFEHAYGQADREEGIPNTMTTRFNLGSINKAFTSLAVRHLAAQGKLGYDDVVGTFLPDYPNEDVREKVTIQHLLDMTSGIGDFFGDRYDATPKENLRTIGDYLPLFADKPLLFEPGAGRRYSNGGYLLLGRLIEVITGEDYYAYVRRTIFEPAGMSDTDWFERDTGDPTLAKGYTKEDGDGAWVRNLRTLPQKGSSAGGGYSTAADLVRFTEALSNGTLGTKDYEFVKGFGIAGGAPGINAAFEWMPEEGIVVVVLTNLDPPTATNVSRLIRDMLPR